MRKVQTTQERFHIGGQDIVSVLRRKNAFFRTLLDFVYPPFLGTPEAMNGPVGSEQQSAAQAPRDVPLENIFELASGCFRLETGKVQVDVGPVLSHAGGLAVERDSGMSEDEIHVRKIQSRVIHADRTGMFERQRSG